MAPDPIPRRLHLWTAVVLAAVFTAGAATGAGLTWAFRPRHPPGGPPHAGGVPPFVAGLGLSPEQEARVRAIAERHRPELEAAIQETFPRMRSIQDQVEREIRVVLTPEQAARFDEMRSRRPMFRGRVEAGGSPGPRPDPPPGMPPGPPPGAPGAPPPPRPPP